MTVNRKSTPSSDVAQVGFGVNAGVNAMELIEADGPPKDLLRSLVQSALQDVIREEFNQFLGSAPYERTEERTGYRNGSYQRSFKTRAGTIELEIPRDRSGNFSPSLFEKYERTEQAFMLAMIEMYFQGVSTRKITKVVEELCGTSVSASTVSNLTRKFRCTARGVEKKKTRT